MDVVGTILGCIPTIVEYTAAPIKQHLSYAFKYHTKVGELKEAVEKLSRQRDELQYSINDARRQAREIYSQRVEQQMAQANKAIEDASALISGEEEEAKKRCFFGMCPNLKGRYKLGKKADKERKEAILPLLDQKTDLESISYEPPLRQNIPPHPPEDLESRAEILKKVIAALENPDVNMVGLYGQGGVGKTYLAEQVHQQATQNNNLFEDVVMVTVSSTPDIQNIQIHIAEFLGLKKDFSDLKTNDARACRLKQRLEKSKVLLILDDLWKNLNLKDIGILKEFRNCKILLTSRFRRTMTEMGAQVIEELTELSDAESYLLLERIVGADELKMVGPSIGEEIAKKCFGLPLLVDINGTYLKGRPLPDWEDKLNKLSNFIDDDLEDKIFKSIDLHYNNLRGEEIKSLFLLCGLLGEFDISMFDLLKYSVGLGLFRRINTLKDARNRLVTLTGDLKSSSLLKNHEKIGFVKIHDMVREAATRIASRDKGVFTMAKDEEWKEWPTKTDGADFPTKTQCNWIYIPWRNIHELPGKLEAPEVQLLALLNEPLYPPSLNVPDSLFDEVNAKLKVVHFAGAYFPSTLPPSLRFLTNLHTLCLENCHVKDVAIIGEMKKLQVLSLRGSDIEQLPKELAHLTQLKLLDLRGCNQLRVIPPEVLSSLSSLEELYMGFLPKVDWAVQGSNKEQSNASLAELECLCRLTTLDLRVEDGRMLPERLHTEKLERYWIETTVLTFRSRNFLKEFGDENPRVLDFKNLDTSIYQRDWLQVLKRRATILRLTYMKELRNILFEDGGFQSLKYLDNSGDSFSKLRVLKVECCHQLKHLFSISMVRSLSQLWNLEVRNCDMIGEIVAVNEGEDGNTGNEAVELTKLSSLTLCDLPELKRFCLRLKKLLPQTAHMSSMTMLTVSENDDNSRLPLFDDMVVLPSLEKLAISHCNNFKMLWNNPLNTSSFNKLKELLIWGSHQLLTVFPSNIVERFQKLEELQIKGCDGIGEIVAIDEGEDGNMGNEAVEFAKLSSLTLDSLPQLKSFCSRLKKLVPQTAQMSSTILSTVAENDDDTRLLLFNDMVVLPSLEKLAISHCNNFKMLWNNPIDTSSFDKLKELLIWGSHKLLTVFPSNILERFQKLEELHIKGCDGIGEIVAIDEGEDGNMGNEAVEFAKLSSLTLDSLPQLKSFCSRLKKLVPQTAQMSSTILSTVAENDDDTRLLLFNDMVVLPSLEKLAISDCDNFKMLWNNPLDTSSFGKLKKLLITGSHMLLTVFPSNILERFQKLEELHIKGCDGIGEIVAIDEGEDGNMGNEAVEFAKLSSLTLDSLPQLKRFCSWLKKPVPQTAQMSSTILSTVAENDDDTRLLLFNDMVVLPSLENLAISDCDNFKMLWNNPLDTSSFGKLKKLLIRDCLQLLTVFPSNILERFQKLEELHIEHCDSIKVIYHLQESSVNKTNDSIAGFQLRILRMKSLRKLIHIWSIDLPGTISLENLRCLVFPQLTELVLDNLPELISFCTDHMLSIEWPQLKFLQATRCEKAFRCTLEQFNAQNSSGKAQCRIQIQHHLFLSEKGFPNCEEMVLDGRLFMGMIMQPSKFQLPSLKSLKLTSPIGWWARYPESSVWLHIQRLPNLRELTLETLQLRELMLYPHEGQGGGGGCLKALATHPIPDITVTSNLGLIRIMNKTELEKFATNPYIERVENLCLEYCLFLENLAPTLVSNFSSLTSLDIFRCHRLISLVTISVATSLVQLKRMNIYSCRMLREILVFDDAAATNNSMQENIVFPKLETLYCYNLPSLRGFYMGSHITLEFPSLKKVYSDRCLKMNVFSHGTLKTPKLEGDLNSTIRELCLDYFRDIETLKLDPSFPWLVEQWHCEQLPFQDFEHLETLVVDNCSCFLFAVPWNLLSSSTTLKSLSIKRCDSLENVFDPEKLKNEELRHVDSVALLEHLHLVDLPKLRNVWNKDPHGILDIRNLKVLKVHNCGNLTELFTLSMALDLVHLRDLEVKQCTSLQVVIKKEEDEQVPPNSTVFPSLVSLYLEYLHSLTSLCSGSYVLNFKGLCKVALVECPNMRISAITPTTDEGDPRDILEGNDEDSRNYLCFLGCKVEASNIQELKVEWNNLIAMWTASNQAEFLKNLEVLEFLQFSKEGLNLVLDLLQKFSKLKKLVLNNSFLKEIVLSSFNIKDENQGSSEQLKVLKLAILPCLNHLMVEDSKPIRDFKYPDCLEVSNCNILSILVLPSVSFETLTTLKVSKCHGLINLMASSAARNMVHLKRISISECKMVTEIVASEEDGAKAEICFRELEHLQLHCLPCLTSFCSGDLCFTFPSLKKVVVIECPKMNTFAPNILSAPLVRKVQITKAKDGAGWLWEGSLNSTIEGLYMEMNS